MSWPRDFIDEVRSSADAVQLIGEVVGLARRGTRFLGLCPFHTEKTPSFGVNDEGLWYCFGCQEGGDLFKFVMQYEGVGFNDAVRSVAERAGVSVPAQEQRSARRSGQDQPQVGRDRIAAAVAAAQAFYREQLAASSGQAAREYLAGRGLGPEVIESFGLGFAPPGWDVLSGRLARQGFRPEELVAAGLAKHRDAGRSRDRDAGSVYDLLRDRVSFPIRDIRRRPIAFGGRIFGPAANDDQPKYINSPETELFNKSRTLYGLGEARAAIKAVSFTLLVEGYLDVLACVQHGYGNVVAPMGTAFGAEHARLLSRHATKVVVAFDGDSAGQAAAERTVGVFLGSGFQVNVLPLPAGQDPDSFLADKGAEGLATALRSALPALAFLLSRAGERADLRSPQGKAQALQSLLGFVLHIEDRVERAGWIGRISHELDVQEPLVLQALDELNARQRGSQRGQLQGRGASDGHGRSLAAAAGDLNVTQRLEEVSHAERELLRGTLHHPEWHQRLVQICGVDVRDPRVAGLLQAISVAYAQDSSQRSTRKADSISGHGLTGEQILAHCDVDGAAALLSRLLLDQEPIPDWDGARGAAEAVRRGALERQLRELQQQVNLAVRGGDRQLADELTARKLQIVHELRGL